MLKKLSLSLVTVAMLTNGCASIISDSSYPVAFDSTPDKASFTIYNEAGEKIHSGSTPSTVTLKAGDGYFSSAKYTIEFQKNGFKTYTANIDPEVDGWYIANILFGGLIGLLIVDPLTGAMYKLPENMNADLDSSKKANLDSNKMTIMLLEDVHQNQRERLVKIN